MDDLDDIPDLDDMSELVQGIKLKQQKHDQQSHSGSQRTNAKIDDSSTNSAAPSDTSADVMHKFVNQGPTSASQNKSTKEFGGMKKGFLFGGGKKSSNSVSKKSSPMTGNQSAKPNDIIRPKLTASQEKNPLVLDDVQAAMKHDFDSDRSWLTKDLLKQIDSNEKLSKQLMDPRISKAVSWMQKDPKGAMEYYKDDVEVQTFFKEFYGILGNHFSKLSTDDKQSEKTVENSLDPADEKAMQNILSNPEIRGILSKPGIQKLLECLRNEPEQAQQLLNAGDSSFRSDVNKLVSAGVLAFQPL